MSKEQVGKIISIVLVAVAAIFSVLGFGVDLGVFEPEGRAVRERIAFDARFDSYLHSGADLYVYSDDHSTQKLHIDGGTGNIDGEGTLDVAGNVSFSGALDLPGNISSSTGAVTITDSANITGAVDLDSTLNVDGAVTLNSTLDVDGNITSGTGAVTITDSVNITGAVDMDSTVNADGAVTLNSTLDVDGNVSSGTGAFTVADSIAITGVFYPSFADETITDGETLTPTVTVYALDSAGAVTVTLAASGVEGQLLILIGDDANDITIADTNIRTNDGAAQVLNQYDVLMLVYQDSEWIEISNSDNS